MDSSGFYSVRVSIYFDEFPVQRLNHWTVSTLGRLDFRYCI